ncbi:hypothetical protein D9613_011397 [Agrocybe pediades]|uniref:Transmembrane protein n=1 Tax=Agrocybe pediades TaxID=84607 RepID=A0A8H4VQ88_9AGAR|nr:hypothetical protein D9613_011397 [Agrocybe pediades]
MATPEPRRVVVDDSDASIQYVGPWFEDAGSKDSIGNFGQAYLSTSHGTNSDASLVFAFNGTQVQIFGTNNVLGTSGTFDPTWECYVDKIKAGATAPEQTAENHWVLCEQDELVDGPHVITLNATVKSQTFWVDQIQYVPSSSVALDQQATYVDNTDPALTDAFGDGWAISGNVANMTNQTNSIFTMNFTGVSLTWYGVVRPELPISPTTGSFAVDGEPPHDFRLEGLSPGEVTQYNHIFFQTPQYSQGQHTMVVTYLGNTNTTPLTLDYLIIQGGAQMSNITVSPPNSTSPSTTPTQSEPGQPTGTMVELHRSSSPAVPAISGVLGAMALLLLVLGFVRYYHRRQQKEQSEAFANYTSVRPFRDTGSDVNASTFVASPVTPSQASTSKTRTRIDAWTNVASTNAAPSTAGVIVNENGGVRHLERIDNSNLSDMPPQYSDL